MIRARAVAVKNINIAMGNNSKSKFYSGAFLYNPKTQSILLHLRDDKAPVNPNKWALFGGGNENNESPEECLIRELNEELGIKVKEDELRCLCDYFNANTNDWHYAFYIESDKLKSEMQLNEGADFDWVPLDRVLEYDLTKNARYDLEIFLAKNKLI